MVQRVVELVAWLAYMQVIVYSGSSVAEAGGDVGEPFGDTEGPKIIPFGAVPESPFGETPGPKGTPLGACDWEAVVVDEARAASLSWKATSSLHNWQWRLLSSIPSYGQVGVVAMLSVVDGWIVVEPQRGTVTLLRVRLSSGSSPANFRRTIPNSRT